MPRKKPVIAITMGDPAGIGPEIAVKVFAKEGHIPLKLLGFKWDDKARKWESVQGVNITLGLPIIRTSVDHGTASTQLH